jgi:hypothetical protein
VKKYVKTIQQTRSNTDVMDCEAITTGIGVDLFGKSYVHAATEGNFTTDVNAVNAGDVLTAKFELPARQLIQQ